MTIFHLIWQQPVFSRGASLGLLSLSNSVDLTLLYRGGLYVAKTKVGLFAAYPPFLLQNLEPPKGS